MSKDPIPPELVQSTLDKEATRLELEAAIKSFEASLWRSRASVTQLRAGQAHDSLQAHLDAISSNHALLRKTYT